ncbi:carbohydrate-binding module family 13 protein [Crucibulum laeve]|uniref:Carbohydrate-binding module family 13 protein n=1 Tax=Crucibulum laeve TaxID=68775 RepID=A0A5C3MB51_9AGAR|nr:carbohydrate-binding module family 13 protein [Crucibulum laeve]
MYSAFTPLITLFLSTVTLALTVSSRLSPNAALTPRAGAPIPSFLHPNGSPDRCLVVSGGNLFNGAPVVLGECIKGEGDVWTFPFGSNTNVKFGQTGFCLDAGSSPANGVGMKIWQCFDSLPAQTWFATEDNRIALAGQGQCLDLTNGNMNIGAGVQIWQCTDNDVNQIWTTV